MTNYTLGDLDEDMVVIWEVRDGYDSIDYPRGRVEEIGVHERAGIGQTGEPDRVLVESPPGSRRFETIRPADVVAVERHHDIVNRD